VFLQATGNSFLSEKHKHILKLIQLILQWVKMLGYIDTAVACETQRKPQFAKVKISSPLKIQLLWANFQASFLRHKHKAL
jgi:hypothetical protein